MSILCKHTIFLQNQDFCRVMIYGTTTTTILTAPSKDENRKKKRVSVNNKWLGAERQYEHNQGNPANYFSW